MKRAWFWFLTLCLCCAWGLAQASLTEPDFKGFVTVRAGRDLYVEWTHARNNQPTVILLNGLTYSTQQWNRFVQALTASGVGVIAYDPFGMGQTLLKYAPIMDKISIDDQVGDLRDLIRALKLETPVRLLGLSYGGGLALDFAGTYPELVQQLILMAPFTEVLPDQDKWIRSQVWLTRKQNPANPFSDEELYDFFLRQIVYITYPKAEPIVLENPFKLEAVFQLTRGIRNFKVSSVIDRLKTDVHLIIAGMDQYVKRSTLLDFWKGLPLPKKQSLIVMNNSEHKIPEAIPRFSAAWVQRILAGDAIASRGNECEGDPFRGLVECPGENLILPREDGEH